MPTGRVDIRQHTRGPGSREGLALLMRAIVRKGGDVKQRDLELEAEMRRIEEETKRKNAERERKGG